MSYILILTIHADPAMPPGYDEWGGTHTYMRELLESLNDLEIDSILVTRRVMEELPEVEQYRPHCTIYRLKNGDIAPIDKTKLRDYHENNIQTIKKIIEGHGELPQVIHSVYWNSGRIGVELAKEYNIPLVHSVISNSLGRQSRGAKEPVPERAEYERLIYQYSKWVLCVSEDEKNDLINFYHISPNKIIVAGQYIHPSFIIPSRNNNGFPRLNSNISFEAQTLSAIKYNNAFDISTSDHFWAYKAFTYFGRIDENKGVDHILIAWCSLYEKYGTACPPLWLIGGSIKEINEIRSKCQSKLHKLREAEQENKIVWWGCVDSAGASTLLLKTLVLVTNSLYEPGGRVITEAMSEGVPVIAAPNGFALDLVNNWENGFLVNHGDEVELALRMEHFIRQPFLSNVLGENARQTAANTVKQWSFMEKHLYAYGIKSSYCVPDITNQVNFFSRREINLFPYRNLPFSNELLCQFVKKYTGEFPITVSEKQNNTGTSDIYRVRGKCNNYIIKHPYTRLALSPIILPVQKYEYVRNDFNFYQYEVSAYEASGTNLFVGKDDFHHLILLRELEAFFATPEIYPDIIKFLSTQYLSISDSDSKKYDIILRNSKLDTLTDIEILLKSLSENLPDFYFEPSGTFCPYLGWKIAPHLIDYNSSAFNDEQIELLHTICNSFSKVTELPSPSHWYEINADVGLRHIMLDNGKMCLINREKRTIGIIENVIADFIFDVFVQEAGGFSDTYTWLKLLNNNIPQECNLNQIVESLSYKLFYETILEGVLKNRPINPYLDALKVLQSKIKIL